MERLSLKKLAASIGASCESEQEIDSICIDTRKTEKGCLFIAIKGDNFDGHDFINKAFELGAVGVISEKQIKHDNVILVDDTRKALLDLARYYRSLFNIFCVGITGSVGKTSTKEMIYSILNEKSKTLKTEGNLNNEIGMPLTIFNLDSSYKNAVFEMGMSNFGEISVLTNVCSPSVGVITNIGISHMETLGSRENILKAKLEIADSMSEDSPLVLCADDDMLQTVNGNIDHPIVYYGIENTTADITASNITVINNLTSFTINFYGKQIDAEIPTIGKHNVYNALAGFAVGLLCDMSPETIVKAMKSYQTSGMRQNISTVKGRTIIADCYNAAPNSMLSALDVITTIQCEGKRVCVLGDMFELGEISKSAHYDVGKAFGSADIDLLICYGERAKDIYKGAVDAKMEHVYHFENKDKAADFIIKNVNEKDAVIYKASRGVKLEEIIDSVNEEWENGKY